MPRDPADITLDLTLAALEGRPLVKPTTYPPEPPDDWIEEKWREERKWQEHEIDYGEEP